MDLFNIKKVFDLEVEIMNLKNNNDYLKNEINYSKHINSNLKEKIKCLEEKTFKNYDKVILEKGIETRIFIKGLELKYIRNYCLERNGADEISNLEVNF